MTSYVSASSQQYVLLLSGIEIYFAYGIHQSNENKALTSFSQIISYTDPSTPLAAGGLKETLHNPQPKNCRDDVMTNEAIAQPSQDHAYENELSE